MAGGRRSAPWDHAKGDDRLLPRGAKNGALRRARRRARLFRRSPQTRGLQPQLRGPGHQRLPGMSRRRWRPGRRADDRRDQRRHSDRSRDPESGTIRSGDRDRPARPRGTARHPAPPSRIGSRRLRSSAHCPKGVGRNRRRLRRLGAARQRPGPPRRTASRRERYPRGDRRLSRTRTSRGRETGGDPRMRACRSRAVARPVDRRSGPALARTRGGGYMGFAPRGRDPTRAPEHAHRSHGGTCGRDTRRSATLPPEPRRISSPQRRSRATCTSAGVWTGGCRRMADAWSTLRWGLSSRGRCGRRRSPRWPSWGPDVNDSWNWPRCSNREGRSPRSKSRSFSADVPMIGDATRRSSMRSTTGGASPTGRSFRSK